jgi:DNA invertase Pin-like site-specific DNA recombinase
VKVAIYGRVSSADQNPQSQLLDLQQLAQQHGWEIVEVFVDRGISGNRVRRPALDRLMVDAARHRFDIVAVAAFDRMARSVRHLLETLDELNRLGIQFISLRENIDSQGPLGRARALFTIIGVVAELERSLIRERVCAGLRRAKLEGQQLGRKPLDVDRAGIIRDRERGMSLGQLAKTYRISRTSVHRILHPLASAVPKTSLQSSSQTEQNRRPDSAA